MNDVRHIYPRVFQTVKRVFVITIFTAFTLFISLLNHCHCRFVTLVYPVFDHRLASPPYYRLKIFYTTVELQHAVSKNAAYDFTTLCHAV